MPLARGCQPACSRLRPIVVFLLFLETLRLRTCQHGVGIQQLWNGSKKAL